MDLFKLRPVDNTAAGIATALVRADAAKVVAQAAITEAKQKRDALLLDGEQAQMTAAEKILAAAREEAERIDALIEQLAARLPVAKRADALGQMDAKLNEMRSAAKAMETWWSKNGGGLLDQLEKVKGIATQYASASMDYSDVMVRVSRDYPDVELPRAALPDEHVTETWSKQIESIVRDGQRRVPPVPFVMPPAASAPDRPVEAGAGALAYRNY